MDNSKTKNKRLLINMLIIGIGTILTKMISFLLTPFYSNWLTPEEFGTYDLIATYISLCIPFVTLQLDQALYRFSMEDRGKSQKYFGAIVRIIIPLLVVVSIFVYCIMRKLRYSEYAPGFIAYFSMLALYNCCAEYLRGNEKLVDYSLHNILVGIITVIASIYLVYIKRLGVVGMLWVYALAYGMSMLIIIVRNRLHRSLLDADVKIIPTFLGFSIPLIPNSISWWITNVSDRTIINIILGNHFNGLYAIGCKIPTMLSLLFSVFNLSFQQVAIQAQGDSDRREYFNNLINRLMKVLFSGSLVIITITPILYYSFINVEYWDGLSCVPVLLCGAIFLSVAQYLGDILLAQKETKVIGISTIIAAIFNIVLNVILIGQIGLNGAAIATLVSYVLMFGIRAHKLSNEIHVGLLAAKMTIYSTAYFACAYLVLNVGNQSGFLYAFFIVSMLMFLVINRKLLSGFIKVKRLKVK